MADNPETQGNRELTEATRRSSAATDTTPPRRKMLPVWFFVGITLVIYGILILITGIAEFSNPPDTVLSNLHASLWWGILLIIMGAVFVQQHRPRS